MPGKHINILNRVISRDERSIHGIICSVYSKEHLQVLRIVKIICHKMYVHVNCTMSSSNLN